MSAKLCLKNGIGLMRLMIVILVFLAGPWEKKNTIQCVKSFISHLWLCSSPTWPLQRALSARTLDRGNSPIFSFYCLSHKKSCCFSVPPTNPAKKKKKHTLPERVYQLNQKFWSTISHGINKTTVNPWLRGHDGSAWQLLKLLKLTRCRICCCRG